MNFTALADLRPSPPTKIGPDGRPIEPWLDGPKLARWIKGHHSDLTAQLGNRIKNLETWEKGKPAQLKYADQILIRLGSHIHELPPHFWIDPPKRRPRRRPEEIEAEEAA